MCSRTDSYQRRLSYNGTIVKYTFALLALGASSAESIIIELFYVLLGIPTLVFGAVTVPLAGIVMIIVHRVVMKRVITVLRDWKILLVSSTFFILSIVTWYDSISRIGAGKVSLIDVPLQTVLVVVLAWIFLHERLNRLQIVGSGIIMVGVITSLSLSVSNTTSFGIGEIESILTGVFGAVSVIASVRLVQRHGAVQVSGFELLIGGIFLQGVWLYNNDPVSMMLPFPESLWLLVMPVIPLAVFLLQDLSYGRIGGALTSVLVAPNIILTVLLVTMLASMLLIPLSLPENVSLAIVAGLISVGGIVTTIFLSERDKNVIKV